MNQPPKGTYNVPSVYVILRKQGKLLLLLREHTGYMDGTYSLPAGHVEENESFLAAAIRETKEEVGVTVAKENMRLVYTMHRVSVHDVRLDLFFEADAWEGTPYNAEPHKHSTVAWVSEKKLTETPVMDYQGVVLQAILDGKVYSEWGWPQDNRSSLVT